MSDGKPSCFVAMPITTALEALPLYNNDKDHFAHVLDHLFVPAIDQSGYRVIRPRTTGADIIQATIIRHLEEADLVLCDISLHNPNVFFELGVRTSLDRPVAVVKDDKTDELPFDTSIINTYSYVSTLYPWTLASQISGISEHIKLAAEQSKGKNGLWQYFGLTKQAALPARTDDPNAAKMDLMLEEIERLRLEMGTPRKVSKPSISDLEAARLTDVTQFLHEAVANNLNRSGKSPESYPKEFQQLIADLAEIAESSSAAIKVVHLAKDSITIDLGTFFLFPGVDERLRKRAAQDSKTLILIGENLDEDQRTPKKSN